MSIYKIVFNNKILCKYSMKKVHIIGGGPTGLFIGLLCKKLNIDCEIYEKNSYIGGHHHVEPETMHAPRCIWLNEMKNLKNILNEFDVEKKTIFQNRIMDYDTLSYTEYIKLWYSLFFDLPINYNKLKNTRSCEYLSFFDNKTRSMLLHINTYIAAESKNSPITKLLVAATFLNIQTMIYRFNNNSFLNLNNDWIKSIENILHRNNVNIHKSTIVTDLNVKNNKVISFNANRIFHNVKDEDEVVLAMDPQGIIKLLSTSDKMVKQNWGDFIDFKNKLMMSTYKSIGITFITNNYSEKNNTWLFDKITNLNITLYYDSNGKYYGSICDLDKTINGKKLEYISPKELKLEIMKDMNKTYPEIDIQDIKIHNDAWYDGEKWQCSHTACAQDARVGLFEPKGNIENLQFRNSLTKGRTFIMTTLETCSESAISYMNSISDTKVEHYKHDYSSLHKRLFLLSIGIIVPLIVIYILYKLVYLLITRIPFWSFVKSFILIKELKKRKKKR